MIQEPFAFGTSWIHRIDPRHKIVSATVFSIIVAVSGNFGSLAAAVIFAAVLVVQARLNAGAVVKRLALAMGFVLLLWAVLPWSYNGQPVMHVGPLTASREGLAVAARITLKTAAILTALMALVATMTTSTLGHAMGRLRVPAKIVYLLLITYRYVFVLEQEYLRLLRAAKVRGFRPRSDLHTYRTFAYLVGMLFVRAWQRAQRVYQAMRCRGFNGRFHSLQSVSADGINWGFDLMLSAMVVSLAVLEWIKWP